MSNTVATRPSQSPANRVKDILLSDKARDQFKMALPKHVPVELLLRIALTAINKVPKLADCTQETLFGCVMELAQMGLVPDGRNAYLIPRWNNRKSVMECTYIVGYQGFIELAYRHPLVKGIRFSAVRAKDFFEYEDGLESKLVHRPSEEEDPGELTHAWAVCELEGGGRTFVVIGKRQVASAKKMQPDSDKPWSPWNVHPDSMWAKTAVRALSKRMPRSAELVAAIDADDKQANAQALDVTATTIPLGTIGDAPNSPTTPAIEEASSTATTPQEEQYEPAADKPAPKPPEEPTLEDLRGTLTGLLAKVTVPKGKFMQRLVDDEFIPDFKPFADLTAGELQDLIAKWETEWKPKFTAK